jgi:hypothetical protein
MNSKATSSPVAIPRDVVPLRSSKLKAAASAFFFGVGPRLLPAGVSGTRMSCSVKPAGYAPVKSLSRLAIWRADSFGF